MLSPRQVILTKSILAKLMIAVHAFAVNFMHAAELPKVPKGDDERQNQCDGSACPSCRYIAQEGLKVMMVKQNIQLTGGRFAYLDT